MVLSGPDGAPLPGIIDVVQGIRYGLGGIGEFVIVYHDPAVAAPDWIEQKLSWYVKRKEGPQGVSNGKVTALLECPIGAPGDIFRVALEGCCAAPKATLPEGWTVLASSDREVVLKSPSVFKREDLKTYGLTILAEGTELRLEAELVDSPATQKERQKKWGLIGPPRPGRKAERAEGPNGSK